MRVLQQMILGLVFVSTPAWSESTGDLETVVAGVESTYKDVVTLSAHFVQVSKSAAMGEVKERGTVELSRPRKMRWAFKGPQAKIFVTNGEKMWIFTEAENQVIVTNELGVGTGDMTQLLSDLSTLDDHFDLTLVDDPQQPKSWVLDAVPKDGTMVQSLSKLRLVIARADNALQALVITNTFGERTEMTFSNLKFNAKVPDSTFEFEVPTGVTVIEG